MSGYKNVAVAGAGELGNFIIDELLRYRSSGKVDRIVVLTRSSSNSEALSKRGVEPIVVDYNSVPSITSALQGIDVVISTLATNAVTGQETLADGAKAAGVKLFVPSEFGGDTSGETEGLFGLKNAQRERLERIGLPWAVFYTGGFADWIFFQPPLGFDLKNGKAEVGGSGDAPVTWTSRCDIARYVVWATTSLPAEKLHNHAFKLESERISINRILEEYQSRTGKKLEITRVPIEQVKANAKNGGLKEYLQLIWDTAGTFGTEEEMNLEWPEFKGEKVVDAILSAQ